MQLITTLLASVAVATAALAQSNLPDGTNCGGTSYSENDIATAISAAISDSNSGNPPDNCEQIDVYYL